MSTAVSCPCYFQRYSPYSAQRREPSIWKESQDLGSQGSFGPAPSHLCLNSPLPPYPACIFHLPCHLLGEESQLPVT
ncbi:hypothetical protein VULLAG_LOCUS5776 [Vulpes lagopus]